MPTTEPEQLTFRDLPDSLEIILLYVVASYGFFFACQSLCPLLSLIMSTLVLLEYTHSAISNLQSDHAYHRQQLRQGKARTNRFLTPFIRKRLTLQAAFALMALTPPLMITLARGDLYGTVGHKYQRSHPTLNPRHTITHV